jgi:hypothetical protein
MSTATTDGVGPFNPRTVMVVIVAGVIAFAAFLLLVAYGGDFRSGRDARAHALSVSANGYAGLVSLVDATGSHSLVVRDPAMLGTRALLIVTPEPDMEPTALPTLLARRGSAPTLIILPKWETRPLATNRAWVESIGMLDTTSIVRPLENLARNYALIQTPFHRIGVPTPGVPKLAVARIGPRAEQQRLDGPGIVPLLVDADDRIVLARFSKRPVYLLAEPDLFDNLGLADRYTAHQAMTILDDLATTNEIGFDLTLNGFATQKSTIKLLFEPPFVPVTLCIFAAALLAGLHGAIRFGAPEAPGRAIAFGKRTLVDNAAMLFRAARKEHCAGTAYAMLTRDLTAQAAGAPGSLTGEALAVHLDRAAPDAGDEPFASLAWHAEIARDRVELVTAAQALYRWRRNRTR